MPAPALIKPTHKAIKQYYQSLQEYSARKVTHEGAVETAFQRLLDACAHTRGWHLIPKQSLKLAKQKHSIAPDGTLRDLFNARCGFWGAKDTHDDLDDEISKKLAKGYPTSNTIFEDTRQAVLYQGGNERNRFDLHDPAQLTNLLNDFFSYTEPEIEDFHTAVEEFKEAVPDLARKLVEIIARSHQTNKTFQAAFADFFALCQQTLNPNISQAAVDEMLVQHLLTERLIRKIFDNPEFTRRNVIAAEIEKVIDALVSLSFNRDDFLKSLDRFYRAIENAAHTLEDFGEKQQFLNTVYERFFQGYSVKTADTHGIVYTPQAIVDFMCASVEEVLKTEFGLTLGSKGVNILDPCTGTGNFIVNLIRRIPKRDLPRVYKEQLFANEVMLLPYYIAALNIEHAYFERAGEYQGFEGLCFVDTLELAEGEQGLLAFMTAANTARIDRQKRTPITVVIGNPPYNQSQQDENDRNKNRKYEFIDRRISETYVKGAGSTLRMQLYDPYVKFFRWATDRLPESAGIVCMITNNGFLTGAAFSGFRRELSKDFDRIYHFDFKGNARTTGERRRKEAGNIFHDKIRAGVGITLLVRNRAHSDCQVKCHAVADYLEADEKAQYVSSFQTYSAVPWQVEIPDEQHNWLPPENKAEFDQFTPVASKAAKAGSWAAAQAIFRSYCTGVQTNSDPYLYDFNPSALIQRAEKMTESFNSELDRWKRKGQPKDLDDFLKVDERVLKWIRNTKRTLVRGNYLSFKKNSIRRGLYRPFTKKAYFFERAFNEDIYRIPRMLPNVDAEAENVLFCCTIEPQIEFSALATNAIPCRHVGGRQGQCFPFYIYAEDGSNRRENITDWALEQFRTHYGGRASQRKRDVDSAKPPTKTSAKARRADAATLADGEREITKWDIFHYVYGLLHHPGYRTKFADNLKRELPRIPFAPDFWAFADAGQELARLHLDYEKLEPHELKFLEAPGMPLSYRVEDKMRLSKDKTSLKVNPSLTLAGIPKEVFDYRLGNRSALDWVIDQYQVSEDKRSGIRSDPNRADDPEYIVRLIGQVVRVSLETVRIVKGLPQSYG